MWIQQKLHKQSGCKSLRLCGQKVKRTIFTILRNITMKLIAFGGTGQSGTAVLRLSADDPDLEVTAFVRKPDKIPTDIRNKLNVVIGDVMNSDEVEKALVGQEAVISCLGTGLDFRKTTVMSKGVENIVNGMRENNVERLSVLSASFLLPGRASFTRSVLYDIRDDHERAINFLQKARDIRWTVAMAPQILNVPRGGEYKVAIDKLPDSRVVTTPDLADWMIKSVKNDATMTEYEHQLVGISSTVE